MTQNEAVVETIKRLGGIASLQEIYKNIFNITECKWGAKDPYASIRRIVQVDKKIYKIKPGLYGLNEYKRKNESLGFFEIDKRNVIKESDHSYYQGKLLEIGNLKKYLTYIPFQDRNKLYSNKKLGDLCTLDEGTKYKNEFFKFYKTVDVIWFNENLRPEYLFEIETTTNFQNSLIKFNEFSFFRTEMIVVADIKKKNLFNTLLNKDSFKELSRLVNFLDFNSLDRQYEIINELSTFETVII